MRGIENIWIYTCTTSGCFKCPDCKKRNEDLPSLADVKEDTVQLYAAEVQAYYFHYHAKNERKEIVY